MKQEKQQGLIRKLAKYAKPYLPYFIIGPLCMIVEVIGEVVMPKFLSAVVTGGTDGTMTTAKSIFYAVMMIITEIGRASCRERV